MPEVEKRIALLIDADNAPVAKIDLILAEVARYGVANVRRAYGNWKSPSLKSWEATLHEYAIQPIQQFAYSKGKNASDMAMVVDGMDLLYARNLDGVAIVSSDADFTPLVMRLRAEGVTVYGFGEKARRRRLSHSSMPARSSPMSRRSLNLIVPKIRPRQSPRASRNCAETRGSFRCCVLLWMRRAATTAGQTWPASAARSATRPPSIRVITVIPNSET